jgi:tRNA U34 5-carboxymethylaminomethyl modifying GTPase MnmE/TrmE
VFFDLCAAFAGKSSLMNALARRPAAIVSPIAGTTRYNVV